MLLPIALLLAPLTTLQPANDPPNTNIDGSPNQYRILKTALTPTGAVDRDALCALESLCNTRSEGTCPTLNPKKSLDPLVERQIRICITRHRTCDALLDCMSVPHTGAPPPKLARAVISADGALDRRALCAFQSACTGEPQASCLDFLNQNPPRPSELRALAPCLPPGTGCPAALACLKLDTKRLTTTTPIMLWVQRLDSSTRALIARVDAFVDEVCACKTATCADRAMDVFRAHFARVLTNHAEAPALNRHLKSRFQRFNRCRDALR